MGVCSSLGNKRKKKQYVNNINSDHRDNISCIIELKSGIVNLINVREQ